MYQPGTASAISVTEHIDLARSVQAAARSLPDAQSSGMSVLSSPWTARAPRRVL